MKRVWQGGDPINMPLKEWIEGWKADCAEDTKIVKLINLLVVLLLWLTWRE